MRVLEGEGPVCSLAYSPDGRWLAAGGPEAIVKLWETGTWNAEKIFTGRGTFAHQRSIPAMAVSPDGTTMAWGNETTVSIWSCRNHRLVHRLEGGGFSVTSLAFDRAGQLLLGSFEKPSGGNAYTDEARCWETGRGLERTDLWGDWGWIDRRSGLAQCVSSLAFAPDGRTLAIASSYSLLFLLNWPVGKERQTLATGRVRAMAFSPDSSLLVTLIRSRRVSVWDFTNRRKAREHESHRGQAQCVTFSPDGSLLVTGGRDGVVVFWDVVAWRERARFDWSVGAVHAVAFAPDGMTLAVGGSRGLVVCDVDGS